MRGGGGDGKPQYPHHLSVALNGTVDDTSFQVWSAGGVGKGTLDYSAGREQLYNLRGWGEHGASRIEESFGYSYSNPMVLLYPISSKMAKVGV
jgi:hypothetical protein